MAGGIISRDLALAKMGARGRISRELTILLKEPPLGCFANLKVFYPKRNVSEKGEALLTLLGLGGAPGHIFAYISVQMRERAR